MLNIRTHKEPDPEEQAPAYSALSRPPAPPAAAEAAVSEPEERLSEIGGDSFPASSAPALLRLQGSSFSEQLRELRAEAGLTIADVAERVRSSQAFIVNLESGELHKIDQHEHYCRSFIERICMLYQAAPEALLEKFEQERARQLNYAKELGGSRAELGAASYIFAEEDLEPEKEQSSVMNLPAITIAMLVLCLFALLLSAWITQKNRSKKSAAARLQIEQGLSQLLKIEKIPLRSLPLPNN